MSWVKGTYRSNHPKDVAARKAKELQERIKNRMCTKSEMWNPTDHNVQKHLKETRLNDADARRLKDIVKKLNPEDKSWGQTERLRPKR